MLRTLFFLIAGLALAAGAIATADPAAAQGRIVGRHGDWQIRCERPVGAPSEQCALVQNVEAQDRANVGLTVIFLHTADRQARILRVLAPLGVLLPSGLGLSIDENEVGLAGFVRCLPEGCIAEVELDDGLMERFEAGNTATFVIFQTPEEGIGIPISLNGFSEGFSALDNPPPAAETPEIETAGEPVETNTRVVAAPPSGAPTASSFSIPPDERSELDRLLEDDLLPYVGGAVAGGMVLLVLIIWMAVRSGRKRRRRRAEARAEEEAQAQSAAEAELYEEHDDEEPEEDLDPAARRMITGRREPPRLAGPTTQRQLPQAPQKRGERPGAKPNRLPTGPRSPGTPRPPRSS
ncbi:invasion associated locus B family protein [Acuticoccus kandeliae]|uniref:invasion associated locus B family protein n=1 Tax=Acuticoccus kandeliae TaxID=2073160 RepID=UPI000D3E8968